MDYTTASLDYQFILLSHVDGILKLSLAMGQKSKIKEESLWAAINTLEDALWTYAKEDENKEIRKELNEMRKKVKKNNLSEKNYQVSRMRFRTLMEMLKSLGILLEREAIGK